MHVSGPMSEPVSQLVAPASARRAEPRGAVTVVSVLRERVEVTLRFVAWYLDLGAARLDLYFDDPEDPAIDLLQGRRRITVTRCTPDFWQSLGAEHDDRFTRRQNLVLTHAYRAATTAWVLNVDADELLWLGGRRLRRFALGQPDTVRALRITPAEAVQTGAADEAHWFRLPMRPRQVRRIYGPDAGLFRSRHGLIGHRDGKSMIRTGLEVSRIRQHWPEDAAKNAITDKKVGKRQNALLLHFTDQGYLHWRSKTAWRRAAFGFAPPVAERLAAADGGVDGGAGGGAAAEERLRELYDRLHRFDEDRLAALTASGRYLRLETDFDAPRRRIFGPD